ncbi:arsenite efflux MFS transporter ArsK [Ensifer adhaerens]|uniref:arsenite efflux MFS transporter ArsK n=1 Tax=Ensifer adhaerens TaxID=106592 RepID=UPI001C4DE4C3|nr:arsenite efflux MFS transporter ArsK [Ensifer adhaerens]MBW0368300.1 arsenite efflux MFS transporter ArsK [Ensifer adhaerens]UCM24958.1 arsenite efflux MFS transporter ArsK [Ensifer adhaerens]
MSEKSAPASLIWALGVTQIIGYGTLYYSFSILAPGMARDFSIPIDWLFGLLSLSLLFGGFIAPKAGGWVDRFGAGRLMVPGSLAAGLALVAAALSPNALFFGVSLVAMEVASAFVLYGTAFAAIVQIGGRSAQRSITHLTLIAGFASTLFWPLTGALSSHLDWRTIYLAFAALNILVCMPIHYWIGRFPHSDPSPAAGQSSSVTGENRDGSQNGLFALMLCAFAIEGLVLASILTHMVPMVTALGLGTAGLVISTLFGPSQVASRLLNMLFGGRLSQTALAVISAGLLTSGLAVLLLTAPWVPGVVLFAILFGLGSGLASIVGGTLPLELFGRTGYGARLGWVSAARQFSSAVAPFAFAFMMKAWGISDAIGFGVAAGALAILFFGSIALLRHRRSTVVAEPVPGA